MKVEYDVPPGMVDMVNGVIGAMNAAYYKAKGKPKDDAKLPIPTQNEVAEFVIQQGLKNTFDANLFYNKMAKRNWNNSDGSQIFNWKTFLLALARRGDCSGITEDPNAPPPPLPTSIRG